MKSGMNIIVNSHDRRWGHLCLVTADMIRRKCDRVC